MSNFPTFISLDVVAHVIPLSRKTLRNLKWAGKIDWLHHVDDTGRYSRTLLVYLPGAIAYASGRWKPEVVERLIELARQSTMSVSDVLRLMLRAEESHI